MTGALRAWSGLFIVTAVVLLAAGVRTPGNASAAEGRRIVVPETDAMLTLPFDLTAQGTAEGEITRIDLAHNVGHVWFGDRAATAVAYQEQPFDAWTLYQVLVTEPDQWHVFWLYCAGGHFAALYYEGTAVRSPGFRAASGSCSATHGPTPSHVRLSATDMPFPRQVFPYDIAGPGLQLKGGAGSIVIGGRSLVLLPFAAVDCSQICGSTGWYELHVLIWDPERAETTVAILYLFLGDPFPGGPPTDPPPEPPDPPSDPPQPPDSPPPPPPPPSGSQWSTVYLYYGLTLPSATLLPDLAFTGVTWSVRTRPEPITARHDRLAGSESFIDTGSCADPVQVEWVYSTMLHTFLNRDGFAYRLSFTGNVRVTYTNLATGQTYTADSSAAGTVDVATGTLTLRGNQAFAINEDGALVDVSGRLIYDAGGNLVRLHGHQRPVCASLGTRPSA